MNHTLTVGILSFLIPFSAMLAIRGEYQPTRRNVYIFKPLTTILIILLAIAGDGNVQPAYKWLIVAGLILCLAGDVFLMLPERYFLPGLGSFLAGHWFYIAAFSASVNVVYSWWWLLPLLVYGGAMYRLLHPHLGKMRGPVIIYIITILLMAWQALGRWDVLASQPALLAAGGAVLFVISDSVLALDRFRAKFGSARVIVLSTYWMAQWLIAYSVH